MSAVTVILYTKPDCALCDRLKEDLAWLGEQRPLQVEERNILEDAEAAHRFRYLIPVVEIDGVVYYPPHDLLQLGRALDTAGAAAR